MAKKKIKIEDESLDAFLTRIHGEGIIASAAEALPPRTRDILPAPLSLAIADNKPVSPCVQCNKA